MTSFQISLTPSRRVAARYILSVRSALQEALVGSDITQSEIAKKLNVHRSVISRELKGGKDITHGRVAELAWALGLKPVFKLVKVEADRGTNIIPGASVLGSSNYGTFGDVGQVSSSSQTVILADSTGVRVQ